MTTPTAAPGSIGFTDFVIVIGNGLLDGDRIPSRGRAVYCWFWVVVRLFMSSALRVP